jgi:hypothetical protein
MASNKISLNPSLIARILGITAFLLVLASIAGSLINYLAGYNYVYGLIPLFNIDSEQNIPTFFSTFLLLFAALLLGVIAKLKRDQADSHTLYWTILSLGFLYMAIDEASSAHELLIDPISKLLGSGKHGIFYFSWVIPVIALVLVLALFFLKFLLQLPPKTRLTFLIAAALYIGGALGYELVGGRYFELYGEDLTYSMMTTVEESLELAGAITFTWALLVYIADNFKEVRIQVDADSGKGENIKVDQ